MNQLIMNHASSLLRARGGPLTSDLLLRPGEFGLGQMPARRMPEATTEMVCGYCSTGCAMEIGLDATGKAVTTRGVADAPVNHPVMSTMTWAPAFV